MGAAAHLTARAAALQLPERLPCAGSAQPSAVRRQGTHGALSAIALLVFSACMILKSYWELEYGVAGKQGTSLSADLATMQASSAAAALDIPAAATGLTAAESCTPRGPGQKVVLVTGTGGFIGYHTALKLRRRGDGVLGFDNFNSYYPVGLKRARALELERAGIFTLGADLNDKEALRKAMKVCQFTHVLHLAAQAGVRYATKDPHSYVASNVAGFVALLEVAKEQQPKPRVVYASSSSVYGLNTKVPFSESDTVDRPASLYAATKKADEMIAHTYNHVAGLALTGLRFFTVYGPHGRPDMAAFAFANKIMKGEPLRIFQGPDGSELERDFTYIDDIVAGCLGAVDHIGPSEKPAPYKIYNLGNRHPEKLSKFVDLLEEFMGKKAVRKYMPLPATGDVLRTHADISLAQADLGYQPTTSLREGLQKFVEWYKDYYKNGLDQEMAEYQPL